MVTHCVECGKGLVSNGRPRQFCSHQCHFKNHRRTLTCPVCGRKRTVQKRYPRKDYCSIQCWGIAHRSLPRAAVCLVCSKTFRPRSKKPNRYCSQACSAIGRRKTADEKRIRLRDYIRAWRRRHPLMVRLQKNRRRAVERGAPGYLSAREWRSVKRKYGNRCAICRGKRKLTIDHIRPLSRGGTNYPDNIQPLCGPCNSRKHAKILPGTQLCLI